MTDDLISWVEERIDADANLDDEVGLLILAALEGDSELDEYLESGMTTRHDVIARDGHASDPSTGAFLRSVRVAGFRGIGAAATLALEPVPGLTVVAGRNGSGKSSLAEGLEILLTGGTYRWKNKRSTQWSDQWRNLHFQGSPEIAVEIVEEGRGRVGLHTTWQTDAVGDHRTTAQRTIDGRKGPLEDATVLGWKPALETYRPILSYDELGGLLEAGPSELYDALAKVLGTEQLGDATARIKVRHTRLSAPVKSATIDRKTLQAEAAALDDERAKSVAALLKKTTPDSASIRKVATGVTLPDRGVLAGLRALSQLECPDPSRVDAAANRLRRAVEGMVAVSEAEAARRLARLDLRRRGLNLHAEFGDQSCPVCHQGTLDASWAATSQELITRDEKELSELFTAQSELEASRLALRALVVPRPAATDRPPTERLTAVVAAAREAWIDLEDVPGSDLEKVEQLPTRAATLADAISTARAAATASLAERDDAWAPLAVRVAAWCKAWEIARAVKASLDQLAAAEKWLKENDTRLKNERIAPISKKAKQAWSVLRQESNVDLGDLRLEGQSTRRRVMIPATIDGAAAIGALPVMSQGELHALTLALFLPRASLDASPFRFVVLDDPVQAMDPAKVDGLVTLLTELAKTRQVVVFSHDDRLPAALRRTSSSARTFEVVRGADSTVRITSAEDPTTRYLGDAEALCRDNRVPDETLRRTLPGLLRMAIESAARDRFYATRLTRGDPLGEVETTWNEAHGTSQRVSLALYDEVRSLDDWLRTEARRKAMGVATSGFHSGLYVSTNPSDAVHHARRAVDDVRVGSK